MNEGKPDDYLSKPVQPAELAAVLEPSPREVEPKESEGATQKSGAEVHASHFRSHASTIFDRAAFLAWLMGNEGLAPEIAKMFIADMPVQIEKLTSAVDTGDCGQAGFQAHKIKGASANVGGEALRQVAFEMEKAAEAGDLDALRTLLSQLENRFARLKEAMEKDFDHGLHG
jgi:HPt (histidine-containing phosphotransfer) domain-containing protein